MVSQDRGVYKKQPTNGESLHSIGWLTVVLGWLTLEESLNLRAARSIAVSMKHYRLSVGGYVHYQHGQYYGVEWNDETRMSL